MILHLSCPVCKVKDILEVVVKGDDVIYPQQCPSCFKALNNREIEMLSLHVYDEQIGNMLDSLNERSKDREIDAMIKRKYNT